MTRRRNFFFNLFIYLFIECMLPKAITLYTLEDLLPRPKYTIF